MKKIIDFWKALPTLGKVCIVIALLAVYSILFGMYEWHRGYRDCEKNMTVDTTEQKTVIRWDTVEIDKPVPVTQYIVKHKTDTFEIHDTLPNGNAVIEIPISQKIYEDTLYRAYVSGYKPNLDSINIYQKTVENITTITKTVKRKPKLSIGPALNIGYNPISKKVETTLGLSIGLPIINKY